MIFGTFSSIDVENHVYNAFYSKFHNYFYSRSIEHPQDALSQISPNSVYNALPDLRSNRIKRDDKFDKCLDDRLVNEFNFDNYLSCLDDYEKRRNIKPKIATSARKPQPKIKPTEKIDYVDGDHGVDSENPSYIEKAVDFLFGW